MSVGLTLVALLQVVASGGDLQPLPEWTWEVPTMRVLGMDDGLSQSSVTAIVQDRAGFLWLGTQDGLNRYDGHGFTVFQHDATDSTTLADDYITALAQAPSGHIWVGTRRGGLARLEIDSEGFRAFPLTEFGPWASEADVDDASREARGRSVWAIANDGAGRLLVGTDVGVLSIDPTTGRAERLPQGDDVGTRAILVVADTLWLGNAMGSVMRYLRVSGGGWELEARVGVGSEVFGLAAGTDGRLWVAANDGGALVLDGTTLAAAPGFEYVRSAAPGSARSVYRDAEGIAWIGSTEGLTAIQVARRQVKRLDFDPGNRRGLPIARIQAVMRDAAGTVWLGTWRGLASLPRLHEAFLRVPTATEYPGGLSAGPVSMARDDVGRLWVGTLSGGLNRLDLRSGTLEFFPQSASDLSRPSGLQIMDLTNDPRGGVWAATFAGGVNFIRPDGARIDRFTLDAGPSGRAELDVNAVVVDQAGRVYAATRFSGLQQLIPGTRTFERARGPDGPWDLGSDYVWPMVETPDGDLWIGAHGGGLNRLSADRRELQRWSTADGLSDDRTLTLFADSQGILWIGTEGGGLNRFDPATEEFKVYTTRDGLPHDNVQGVLEDERGFLWISTNDGLARFDRDTEEFWVFRENAGLAGNRFYANAALESEDGLLHFGGERGLTIVDPSLINRNPSPPPVALTRFRIQEEDAPISRASGPDGIVLEYEERFFTLSFAALDFTDPSQNRYQYKLDPLQTDWVDVGNENVATYTSVPPDRYTFAVRARNSEGAWNEQGLAIPVWVKTPWWLSWWFRLFVAGVIALMISALYSYRLQQMRRRDALRLKFAGQLHDDIGANLTAMSLKADVAYSFATKGVENLSELTDISRLAKETALKVRETVWVVNTSYDTVAGMVSKMQDTLDMMLAGEVKTSFSAPPRLATTPIEMELRQDVYLLYKELLQNIAKHAGAASVSVVVRYEAPVLTLTVSDDGAGFDLSDPSLGNGLGLMRRRAANHGGDLSFESAPGGGTRALLKVRMR